MAWGEKEARLDTSDVTLAIEIAEIDGNIAVDTLGEPLMDGRVEGPGV